MFGSIFKNTFNDKFSMDVRASYYKTNWNDETTARDTSKTNLFRAEVQTNYKISENYKKNYRNETKQNGDLNMPDI